MNTRILAGVLALLLVVSGSVFAETVQLDIMAIMPEGPREAITEAYKKERPNVELIWSPTGGYWNTLTTRIAGGVAPDVMYWGTYGRPLMEGGNLLALDEFIERDGFEIAPWANQPDLVTSNGHTYGLPWWGSNAVFAYNKQMFLEAGVAEPDDTWTWETLRQAARALTRRSADGGFDRRGVHFSPSHIAGGWGDLIVQSGARHYTDGYTEIFPDREETLEAFEFMRALTQEDRSMDASLYAGGEYTKAFYDGNLGMMYNVNSGLLAMRSQDLPFDWDIAPLPKGKERTSNLALITAVISEQTNHPEEAWNFIKWVTAGEGAWIIARALRGAPLAREILTSSEYYEALPGLNLKVMAEHVMSNTTFAPAPPRTSEIGAIMNGVARDVIWNGTLDPATGYEMITSQVNAILKEEATR